MNIVTGLGVLLGAVYFGIGIILNNEARKYVRGARNGGPDKYLKYEVWLSHHWYAWPLAVWHEMKDDTAKTEAFLKERERLERVQYEKEHPPYPYDSN